MEIKSNSRKTEANVFARQFVLRDELEFKSFLLDNATDSVFVHDRDLNLVYANEAAYKDRGFTKEEFLALAITDLVTPGHAGLIKQRQQKLQSDGSLVFESSHICKDGSIIEVEVQSRLVELDGQSLIIGVARNITEQRLAERRAKRTEWLLRDVLDRLQQVAVTLDVSGDILYANDFLLELTGRVRDEAIRKNWFELFIPPGQQDALRAAYAKAQADGDWEQYEQKILMRGGGTRLIRFTNVLLKNAEGRLSGVTCIGEDTTERKRAKELSDSLNGINAIINSTLDIDEMVKRVVSAVTPALGVESTALYLLENGDWVLRYAQGTPLHAAGERVPYGELLPTPDKAKDEPGTPLVVPIMAGERMLGVLAFRYSKTGAKATTGERDFAGKLCVAISLALENARLFSEQRDIADTLQEALLTIPERIADIDFGHLYRSATETAKVGGDFYDLFEIENHKVGIIIGDVSGKGLEAATLTALIKNTIRAYAYEHKDPALVLSKANKAVLGRMPGSFMFITTIFGVLDTRLHTFTYANAGHPPPILIRDGSGISVPEGASLPIGVFDDLRFEMVRESVKPGDVLALYTDGAIEARGERGMLGEAGLIKLIEDSGIKEVKDLTQEIFDGINEFSNGHLSDDLALLVITLKK